VVCNPTTAATEEYNGATWTTVPPGLNTAKSELAGAGIQTSALAFGGGAIPQNNMMEQVGLQ
jgi:hypothetical protein